MAQSLESWRAIMLAKPGSQEDTPFGPDALVYKVAGKMFGLIGVGDRFILNLKCDPQDALILREAFTAVTPGYHMNKQHWNTVDLTAGLEPDLITDWIDDSYQLVVRSLPKKLQTQLLSPTQPETRDE
ncbi:MmcQ/YjbR family DNA-binding protein [Saccharospirillum impatiens]|uniref:MmcQ/YjbR family DNA-binding protein n=1 Tax=Saccharospirillum impatiens TaxID=169438 RepID=UPI000400B882|nr:MmcQ/YjbR family DNA-binding protein [Saccharospirillum impatiens]